MNTIQIVRPVKFFSAKELRDMNYSDMMKNLEAQERQCNKDKRIGSGAMEILKRVDAGMVVTFRDVTKKTRKYREYFVGDFKIDKRFLLQLERRGFLTMPTQKKLNISAGL